MVQRGCLMMQGQPPAAAEQADRDRRQSIAQQPVRGQLRGQQFCPQQAEGDAAAKAEQVCTEVGVFSAAAEQGQQAQGCSQG